MSIYDDSGPAFPVSADVAGMEGLSGSAMGMSLRQYAAIHLRVPDSGVDWLDEMIRARESAPAADPVRDAAPELLEAAKSARDALEVAIKAAWEGFTDADVAEHIAVKKLDAAIARATGQDG